jgi:hypothetical protein
MIYLDDRDMFGEFCLDYSLSFHHIKNETKFKSQKTNNGKQTSFERRRF